MYEEEKEMRFSPISCREDSARDTAGYAHYVRMGIIVAGILVILLHIELGLGAGVQAPETVLLQVLDDSGRPETAAQCYADIVSDDVNEKKKPLKSLDSLYEILDPRAFQANHDKGFHVLDTGFVRAPKEYEIRIVCYAPELSGVSYTIINEENTQECAIKEDGRLLLCTD